MPVLLRRIRRRLGNYFEFCVCLLLKINVLCLSGYLYKHLVL